MCFSASASFVAGTALLAVGVATLRQARSPAELPFAAVPLLFGVQQGVEGAFWLGLRADTALLNTALTQIYSFFSHVLWPVYVPLAVLLLEPAAGRRKVLESLLALGAATALYLFYTLIRFPISADGHIRYLAPHFYAAGVMAAYRRPARVCSSPATGSWWSSACSRSPRCLRPTWSMPPGSFPCGVSLLPY